LEIADLLSLCDLLRVTACGTFCASISGTFSIGGCSTSSSCPTAGSGGSWMTGSEPSLTVGMGGVATGVDIVISGIVGVATTEEGAGITISRTFGAASTGSEKKWLLNHRSRYIHPLLLKVNFSRYNAPPHHFVFYKDS